MVGIILLLLIIFKTKFGLDISQCFFKLAFLTSNSGWTFDLHDYEPSIFVFELNMRFKDHMQWHLFIMDSYSSYIVGR